MSTQAVIWVIVAVIVVIALVALVAAMMGRRRTERNRTKAAELRLDANAQERDVERQEAEARATQARAEQARAEADRLVADASDRQSEAAALRQEHVSQVREADRLDPEVDTKDPAYRPLSDGTTDRPESADRADRADSADSADESTWSGNPQSATSESEADPERR